MMSIKKFPIFSLDGKLPYRPLASALLAPFLTHKMLCNEQTEKEPPTGHDSHREPTEQTSAIATVHHRFTSR